MTGDQFRKWLTEHKDRNPRHDWPEGDAAITFFGHWLHTFKARQIRPEEADDASRHLAEQGGAFPDNHLGLLLGRVEAERRRRVADTSALRHAEQRAAVAAEVAREEELRARWRAIDEAERRRIVADVEAENPGLRRWKLWVLRLAMARAAEAVDANR